MGGHKIGGVMSIRKRLKKRNPFLLAFLKRKKDIRKYWLSIGFVCGEHANYLIPF